jgi:MGT family glycosyltransferase
LERYFCQANSLQTKVGVSALHSAYCAVTVLSAKEPRMTLAKKSLRILVTPHLNNLAHTSRPLQIAKELRARGHRVNFAGEGVFAQIVTDAGFGVLPLVTLDRENTLRATREGHNDWYTNATLRKHVDAELALLAREKPDMVISDFRPSISISCEQARVPLCAVLNASWTNYSAVKERAPEHVQVTRIIGRTLASAFLPWIKPLVMKQQNRRYAALRQERGLSKRVNILDTFTGDLNLLCDAVEYGPIKGAPSHFHHIGPIRWEPEVEAPWLDEVVSSKGKRKLIYITIGSTGKVESLPDLLSVFSEKDFVCVVSTAGLTTLPHVAENVHVFDMVPASKLMPHVDALVCQGGNGSIYQALDAGVPIVGVPTMLDQEANLDRVEQLRVGVHLSGFTSTPTDVLRAVNAVVGGDYRQRAEDFAQVLRRYDAPRAAADLIESILTTPHRT